MPIAGSHRMKELFHAASGVTIHTNDVKRCRDFLDDKLYDMLLMAAVTALANRRDIIQPSDIPLTKGLQERMREFDKLAQEISIQEVLEQLAGHQPLDADPNEDVEDQLPSLLGGLSVALAQSFVIIDPQAKNPGAADWDLAVSLFSLLL